MCRQVADLQSNHAHLRVHDKRPMLHDGLSDRPASYEQEAHAAILLSARAHMVPFSQHQRLGKKCKAFSLSALTLSMSHGCFFVQILPCRLSADVSCEAAMQVLLASTPASRLQRNRSQGPLGDTSLKIVGCAPAPALPWCQTPCRNRRRRTQNRSRCCQSVQNPKIHLDTGLKTTLVFKKSSRDPSNTGSNPLQNSS